MSDEKRYYVLKIDHDGNKHVEKGPNDKGFDFTESREVYDKLEAEGGFSDLRTILVNHYYQMGHE